MHALIYTSLRPGSLRAAWSVFFVGSGTAMAERRIGFDSRRCLLLNPAVADLFRQQTSRPAISRDLLDVQYFHPLLRHHSRARRVDGLVPGILGSGGRESDDGNCVARLRGCANSIGAERA